MKENYTFTSYAGVLLAVPIIFLTFLIAGEAKSEIADKTVIVAGLGGLLICGVVGVLSASVPCCFDAKRREVTFTVCLLKHYTIRYSDIRSIAVTREHFDTRFGTKWEETIRFVLADGEKSFTASMPLDLDEIDDDPAALEKQCADSRFSKLKAYIEKRIDETARRAAEEWG
ncbi:MAG: hypothetical protein IK130_10710 [Oscillospiraceae bacterium]|nr:hypothetical protein [Oscillospiraceae bacterium]